MTLSFDIRRVGMLGLALLFAMAVVGPACLVFASSALAMPSHEAPMSGCDAPANSMDACPHDNPLESSPAATQQSLPQVEKLVAVTAAFIEAPTTSADVVVASDDDGAAAPVAHLTPLRL